MINTAIRIDDPELVTAFAQAIDNGKAPDVKTLQVELKRRDVTMVKRALARAAEQNLITLDPPTVPERTRQILAVDGRLKASLPSRPAVDGEVQLIKTEDLRPSPLNPRKTFNEDELEELASAISAEGLLQNLGARPDPENPGKFEIVFGERRYRAIEKLKAEERISEKFNPFDPVEVRVRELSDADVLMLAISENADRVNPHPLEEAEAYVQLRDLRAKQDGKEGAEAATLEIAEATGKSRRHIQLRIALATKLSAASREAFRDGKISLAQARALAQTDERFQDSAVCNIERGWWKGTAQDILDRYKSAHFPAAHAEFDLAEYGDADRWTDDEGALFLTNTARAEELQRKAAERFAAELLEKGFAFAEIVDWHYRSEFPSADENDPKAQRGALVIVSAHTLKIEIVKDVVRSKDRPSPTAAAEASENDVKGYERRHVNAGRAARTAAVQEAMTDGKRSDIAQALTLLSTLQSSLRMHDDGASDGSLAMAWTNISVADSPIRGGGFLAALLAKNPVAGLVVVDDTVQVNDHAAALLALIKRKDLSALFTAAITDRLGSWQTYDNTPGDTPTFIAIAQALGLNHANHNGKRPVDEAYFKRFSRGTMLAHAERMQIGPGEHPAKKAELAAMLAKQKAAAGYVPPEYRFSTSELMQADIDALITGNATPAQCLEDPIAETRAAVEEKSAA